MMFQAQLRHFELWFAGSPGNWALAGGIAGRDRERPNGAPD
jgi:hypothetical protein